jgi:hypothetical protein
MDVGFGETAGVVVEMREATCEEVGHLVLIAATTHENMINVLRDIYS